MPVLFRRITAPRQNSWLIVPSTNAENTKQIPDDQTRTPSARTSAAAVAPATVGQRNWYRRFSTLDFRHASSGPMPVSSSSMRPIGSIHRLKNGGPTVSRSPVTASLSVGNIVAKSTKNAQNSRIQLFTRNAASRDAHESSSLLDRSSGSR